MEAMGQPQPGEWCFIRSKNTNEEFVARFLNHKSDGTPVFECSTRELWQEVEILRHLPNCTGFNYVPPPELTPAEKRLRELDAEEYDKENKRG
ncbi:MAG TPA: hypothetical protein DDW52_19965 [Planctomycetaceae bacterium]|nr:hypothetical protein [Planctomycetaceae bacterium]